MPLATVTVASFDNGGVVITAVCDDSSLVVSEVGWDNQTGAAYDVQWGDTAISVPSGSGSKRLPRNKFTLVPDPDDGFAWGFTVRCGRAR